MQFRLLLGALLPLIVCACGEQPQSAPQTSSGGSGGVGGTGDMGVGGENQAGATSSSGGSGGTQTDGGAGGEPGCSSKMPTIERGKVEPTDVTQATFGFVNNATNDLSFAWTWGQTVVSLSTQLSDGTFVTRSPFSSADPDQRPRAQIAANGRAFLAASDGGTVHLASAETATSEDWTLHTLPAANHTRVFFASNDENRVIAAWTQKDEEGPYVIVWSEYLPDSDSWAEPRPVVELNVHFPVVDLVADDDGDFHLLYYKNGTHIARLGASADAFSESESLSINSPTGTFSLASDGTLVAAFHSDTQASVIFYDYATKAWTEPQHLAKGSSLGRWITQVVAVPGAAYVAAPVEVAINPNRVGVWKVEPNESPIALEVPPADWAPSEKFEHEQVRLGSDLSGGLLLFHTPVVQSTTRPIWLHHYDACSQSWAEPVLAASGLFNAGPSGSLPDGRTWFAYEAGWVKHYPQFVLTNPSKTFEQKAVRYSSCRDFCLHLANQDGCSNEVAGCIQTCGDPLGERPFACTPAIDALYSCRASAEWVCTLHNASTADCDQEQEDYTECVLSGGSAD